MEIKKLRRFLKALPFACLNCNQPPSHHADGKCLFDSTDFNPATWPEILSHKVKINSQRLYTEASWELLQDYVKVEHALLLYLTRPRCRNCNRDLQGHESRNCRIYEATTPPQPATFFVPATMKIKRKQFIETLKEIPLDVQWRILTDAAIQGAEEHRRVYK